MERSIDRALDIQEDAPSARPAPAPAPAPAAASTAALPPPHISSSGPMRPGPSGAASKLPTDGGPAAAADATVSAALDSVSAGATPPVHAQTPGSLSSPASPTGGSASESTLSTADSVAQASTPVDLDPLDPAKELADSEVDTSSNPASPSAVESSPDEDVEEVEPVAELLDPGSPTITATHVADRSNVSDLEPMPGPLKAPPSRSHHAPHSASVAEAVDRERAGLQRVLDSREAQIVRLTSQHQQLDDQLTETRARAAQLEEEVQHLRRQTVAAAAASTSGPCSREACADTRQDLALSQQAYEELQAEAMQLAEREAQLRQALATAAGQMKEHHARSRTSEAEIARLNQLLETRSDEVLGRLQADLQAERDRANTLATDHHQLTGQMQQYQTECQQLREAVDQAQQQATTQAARVLALEGEVGAQAAQIEDLLRELNLARESEAASRKLALQSRARAEALAATSARLQDQQHAHHPSSGVLSLGASPRPNLNSVFQGVLSGTGSGLPLLVTDSLASDPPLLLGESRDGASGMLGGTPSVATTADTPVSAGHRDRLVTPSTEQDSMIHLLQNQAAEARERADSLSLLLTQSQATCAALETRVRILTDSLSQLRSVSEAADPLLPGDTIAASRRGSDAQAPGDTSGSPLLDHLLSLDSPQTPSPRSRPQPLGAVGVPAPASLNNDMTSSSPSVAGHSSGLTAVHGRETFEREKHALLERIRILEEALVAHAQRSASSPADGPGDTDQDDIIQVLNSIRDAMEAHYRTLFGDGTHTTQDSHHLASRGGANNTRSQQPPPAPERHLLERLRVSQAAAQSAARARDAMAARLYEAEQQATARADESKQLRAELDRARADFAESQRQLFAAREEVQHLMEEFREFRDICRLNWEQLAGGGGGGGGDGDGLDSDGEESPMKG
ncbi:hypothetical protein, variant [Fonticula alba]|nr:hypothetical protein, variant [Fonticula alba]KCV72333.1 hypothetical protein, variant [Fonticula alba]|eukprot:XP_009493910.1 hypothetical protein, variant [Fonticula alba]